MAKLDVEAVRSKKGLICRFWQVWSAGGHHRSDTSDYENQWIWQLWDPLVSTVSDFGEEIMCSEPRHFLRLAQAKRHARAKLSKLFARPIAYHVTYNDDDDDD